MSEAVRIEKWAENLEEVTVHEWLKSEGDCLEAGESLCVIITEKVTFEYEVQTRGVVRKIYCPEGSVVPVGYVIAWIGEEHEAPPSGLLEDNAAVMAEYRERLQVKLKETAGAPASAREASSRVPASPAARRLAREQQISLAEVLAARGGEGRVSEAEVRAYLAAREAD